MSAISGSEWASLPNSSEEGVNGFPPEDVNLSNLCCREAGTDGALYEWYPEVGAVLQGLL